MSEQTEHFFITGTWWTLAITFIFLFGYIAERITNIDSDLDTFSMTVILFYALLFFWLLWFGYHFYTGFWQSDIEIYFNLILLTFLFSIIVLILSIFTGYLFAFYSIGVTILATIIIKLILYYRKTKNN
ncbi:hypothetical protein [Testudinibacter sp. TR-2022]|uniref:hypothetical protein n=1 Tax=Testudinibacter sp. TR-2022 TaxID=2585029 RepID=UPI00111921CC|nr:hypothetical protein [Testudinibacter sp. TR-2022]TNH07061.1 hypothetical protein FHQ30_05290 [Pasteurellaceae bacterium Phil11]TNH22792.1 hypothetical protein FHQ29_06795 [Testudinibacter sp. TR-2022]TNH26390.1 hypothetical protein FHQ27_07585 [Testudinibacter sp. TR-2022]